MTVTDEELERAIKKFDPKGKRFLLAEDSSLESILKLDPKEDAILRAKLKEDGPRVIPRIWVR
ncbi:MAG: hypothetical protein P4L62_01085 [Candidatus Pacebacteria bacterium]|nr:hypothetical protein [Candidatus Paceibacterota bacterium]